MAECLPNMQKALGSVLSAAKEPRDNTLLPNPTIYAQAKGTYSQEDRSAGVSLNSQNHTNLHLPLRKA